MNGLVVVARLKEGCLDRVRDLVAEGPPFDLAESAFEAHEVFLGEREVVFVFEGRAPTGGTLAVAAEDPAVWRAAKAWSECLDGRPRVARLVFSWKRAEAGG